MLKKLKKLNYRSDLLNDLKNDIGYAAKYLSAALADSQEAFLVALRDVAEANKVARVAEEANVSRESLYRTLSKEGNPRFTTLDAVLSALGMTLAVQVKHPVQNQAAPTTPAPKIIEQPVGAFELGAHNITITSTSLRTFAAGDVLTFANAIMVTTATPNEEPALASAGTFPPGFIAYATGNAAKLSIHETAGD